MGFCREGTSTRRPAGSASVAMGEPPNNCQSFPLDEFEVIRFDGIDLAINEWDVEAMSQDGEGLDVSFTGTVLRRKALIRGIARRQRLHGSFSGDAAGCTCWTNQSELRPLEKPLMRGACGERLLGAIRP